MNTKTKKTTKKPITKELLKKAKMDEIEEEIEPLATLYEADDFEEMEMEIDQEATEETIAAKSTKKPDDYEHLKKIDILRIDLMIFNILKQKAIEKSLEFVDIYKYITLEDLFPLQCSKKWVAKRIFFNIDSWYVNLKKISEKPEDTDANINTILQMCRSRKLKPDGIIFEKNWKKQINFDKYYETFLELKLTPSGLEKARQITFEIKEELRNQSWIYQNIKVIQWYAGNIIWTYKATAWLLILFALVLGMFYNKTQINNWLESNQYFASMLWQPITQFELVDTKDIYYITLQNTLIQTPWLETINQNVDRILVRDVDMNTKEFKVILNSSQEVLFKVENKGWVYQVIDVAKYIRKDNTPKELKY